MNRKGSLFDIVAWVVIAFVVVVFLGLWLYGHNLITQSLESVPDVVVGNNTINVSNIATQTFGVVNTAEQTWLPIIAFIIIVCEGLLIWITNVFIKEHPIMFIPYAFVTAAAVVISAYLSNAYQNLLSGLVFSPTLATFTMADFVMIYLPYWTAVIGAVGTILLLSQIIIPSQGNVGGDI